jgi:transcriptional regulator GlxA family with amidase domain
MRKVVITGASPVQVMDVTGPFEVFSSVPGYKVELGNPEGDSVWRTYPELGFADAKPLYELDGPIDTLVIAGGPGSEKGVYDERFVEWIGEAAQRSRRIAAICTGTFLLAAAGLLDGKQAVTHWKFFDRLAREFPAINVQRDPIYLRDGSVYTSAGIMAGLDLSLAMLEEDYGHQAALEVARQLVMFLVRPGGQSQYSHMLSRQANSSKPLRKLQVCMLENLREDLTVERLAERLGMSARNFTRTCLSEMRMTPGQFVDRLRVEAAQQMIDSSSKGLKEIADACGFKTPEAMRRTFLRVLGVSASTYASRFNRARR